MKISQNELETLLGPLIAGVLTGLLAAFCTVAFVAEYAPATLLAWPVILEIMLNFVLGFLITFGPLGLAPVCVARLDSSFNRRR